MKEAQPTPPKDQKVLARSLLNSADERRAQGKYAEAEPLYRQALAIAEEAFGSHHLEVSVFLNNLAVLYKYTGNFDEAQQLYQRALEITEAALGSTHPSVATIYH